MLKNKISSKHIPGRRDLSSAAEIIVFNKADEVSIALTNNLSNKYELYVNDGDQVKKGQKIGMILGTFEIPVHSSVSGTVVGVKRVTTSSGRPSPCIIIKNDFNDDLDTSLEPIKDINSVSKEDLVQRIKDAGIVGMGGGGFPTYVKYNSPANIETVVLNSVECEPYITADYRLIKEETLKVVKGVEVFQKAAGAKNSVIVIKEDKKELIDKINETLKGFPTITLSTVPDVYPAGWERYIVEKVFDKKYDRLPSEAGLVINNTGSAKAAYDAVYEGMPLIERFVTFSGEGFKNPGNVIIPVGAKAKDIIELIGDYSDQYDTIALLGGGPMMGKSLRNEDFSLQRNDTSVLAIPQVDTKKKISNFFGVVTEIFKYSYEGYEQICFRCGKCVDNCPTELSPVLIKDAAKAKDKELANKLNAKACIECGLCSYVCPSNIEITDWVRRGKRLANR